jgi:hypothetical protein
VSKALFVVNLATAIVSSSKERTESYQDGTWYVCKWNSGFFDYFSRLQLENFMLVDKSQDKRPCFEIKVKIDNFETQNLTAICVPEYNPNNNLTGDIFEPLGFYERPPSEMIYD